MDELCRVLALLFLREEEVKGEEENESLELCDAEPPPAEQSEPKSL